MVDGAACIAIVRQQGCVRVHDYVLVDCTPFVMTWEDGVELSHAVAAGRLQAAHLSGVQTTLTHGGINATVTARGVGLWPGEVSIVLDSFDWERREGENLTAQMSMNRLGTGSQVLISMNCISRWTGTPGWPSVMF